MTKKTRSIPAAPPSEAPPHQELILPRGLSEELAAIYSGVSASALRKARMDGGRIGHLPPPPYVRLGRKVIYLIDDLDHWLESNRVGSGEIPRHYDLGAAQRLPRVQLQSAKEEIQ